jgi:hypothetical protein
MTVNLKIPRHSRLAEPSQATRQTALNDQQPVLVAPQGAAIVPPDFVTFSLNGR